MIAILISVVMLGQSDSLSTGAKMRHEANKLIMGMQNVPYDVADVLNGSNYTVEQATAIAAQRRQNQAIANHREVAALKKDMHESTKKVVKGWVELDKGYDLIISGKMVPPPDQLEAFRGTVRRDLANALLMSQSHGFSRNVRNAAKAHAKKVQAALDVLEKQNPGVEPGK